MPKLSNIDGTQRLQVAGSDVEISARLEESSIVVEISKAGTCIHTLQMKNVTETMEHLWLADLFGRTDIFECRDLAHVADRFLLTTNTNQG